MRRKEIFHSNPKQLKIHNFIIVASFHIKRYEIAKTLFAIWHVLNFTSLYPFHRTRSIER